MNKLIHIWLSLLALALFSPWALSQTPDYDLTKKEKTWGTAMWCPSKVPEEQRSTKTEELEVEILGSDRQEYVLGDEMLLDVELKNSGEQPITIPIETDRVGLLKKHPALKTYVALCIHVDYEPDRSCSRMLFGAVEEPTSLKTLEPGESITFRDKNKVVLLEPEKLASANSRDKLITSLHVAVSVFLIQVGKDSVEHPYNDCILPGEQVAEGHGFTTLTIVQKTAKGGTVVDHAAHHLSRSHPPGDLGG